MNDGLFRIAASALLLACAAFVVAMPWTYRAIEIMVNVAFIVVFLPALVYVAGYALKRMLV